MQGAERELVLEEVNGYQRAIQYQQLEKAQFGAAEPPGFYFEVASADHFNACQWQYSDRKTTVNIETLAISAVQRLAVLPLLLFVDNRVTCEQSTHRFKPYSRPRVILQSCSSTVLSCSSMQRLLTLLTALTLIVTLQAAEGLQGRRAIRLTRASAAEVEAFHQHKKEVRRRFCTSLCNPSCPLFRLQDLPVEYTMHVKSIKDQKASSGEGMHIFSELRSVIMHVSLRLRRKECIRRLASVDTHCHLQEEKVLQDALHQIQIQTCS